VSPVGALGLMQLMPDVAAELGAIDPMDPRQNVMAGARYLRQLLDAHRGDVRLALASYNAGPGNVAKYRAIPPFKETRDYVKRVTALLAAED
jgi:soluble lytic murein transglycosylase-like protein